MTVTQLFGFFWLDLFDLEDFRLLAKPPGIAPDLCFHRTWLPTFNQWGAPLWSFLPLAARDICVPSFGSFSARSGRNMLVCIWFFLLHFHPYLWITSHMGAPHYITTEAHFSAIFQRLSGTSIISVFGFFFLDLQGNIIWALGFGLLQSPIHQHCICKAFASVCALWGPHLPLLLRSAATP